MEQHKLSYLLGQLRKSIEIWINIDDAPFQHIHMSAMEIIQHGLYSIGELKMKEKTPSTSFVRSLYDLVSPKYPLQTLIDDFEWVRRSAQVRDKLDCRYRVYAKTPMRSSTIDSPEQFLSMWTLRNLEVNSLGSCLQVLVADKELLENYYKPCSFLRNENYATALFICLSALELRQSSLLSQIEPDLYKVPLPMSVTLQPKRSSSHPNISISLIKRRSLEKQPQPSITRSISLQTSSEIPHSRRVKSLPNLTTSSDRIRIRPRSKTLLSKRTISGSKPISVPRRKFSSKLKSDFAVIVPSSSSSSYQSNSDDTQPSSSTSSKLSQSTLESMISNATNTTIRSTSSGTPVPLIHLIKCDDIKIWTDREWENENHHRKTSDPINTTEACNIQHSIKETNISPINSFLSNLFSTPNDPSGALYSCSSFHSTSSSVLDSFMPKYGKKLPLRKSQNLFDDDPVNVATTSISTTPIESIPIADVTNNSQNLTDFLRMTQLSRNNDELEKENAHFRVSEAIISAIERIKRTNIGSEKLRRQNDTTTAMDWQESEQNQTESSKKETQTLNCAEVGEICLDSLSAEAVGLSLISKFNDQHLPKVSELKWLLTEEDGSHESTMIHNNNFSNKTNPPVNNTLPSIIRGNKYWAPPRQQVIFTDHPIHNRKDLIQKQNNRCAGCGMWVSPQYMNSFRYCTYLGKYHCTGCHRNQISPIPAKILQKWDFKCYPVSIFAYHLLEQIYTWPLFYVPALNPQLYNRSKELFSARTRRAQLRFINDFIKACRFATIEKNYFNDIPDYICKDIDIWSISDFVSASSKNMEGYICELILKCEAHVFNCVLCTARGFLCEHCRHEEVIFPWQYKVYRCDHCGGLFHINCWKTIKENCLRCLRIRNRQEKLAHL